MTLTTDEMEQLWAARAREIKENPMPRHMRHEVNIKCNGCGSNSMHLCWHVLGVQCPKCHSFDTIVERIIESDEEPPPNPPTGAGAS